MKPATQQALLVCLVVAAFVLRIGYCSVTSGLGRSPDEYREYVILGQRLAALGEFVSPLLLDDHRLEPSNLMPPAYAALVAVAYSLLGAETGQATAFLKVVNALASALAVLFSFWIAARVAGTRAAWIAAVLAALNPLLIGFTDFIWDTSLFSLGVVLIIWVGLILADRPLGWLGWFGYGVLLGLLALLNPALTAAYPLLVLWPLHRSGHWRARNIVRAVTVSVMGWLVAVSPWTVRNYAHFGELSYIRGGFGLQLWLGVCPEADQHGAAVFTSQYPLNNPEMQEEVGRVGERAFIEERARLAKEAMRRDPLRFARLAAIRFVDYWAGTTFSHSRPGGGGWPRTTARTAVMFFLSGESLVILVCLCVSRRVGRDLWWLIAIVLSFCVVYLLTHVQVRFRAPTEPLIAVILAGAVRQLPWSWRG